jgi:hypothetical protein
MTRFANRRLTITWLALSAVTVLSWYIGAKHGHRGFQTNVPVTFGVVLIAAVKVRLIITEFMDARRAPALLRRIADAWLALLVVTLLSIYVIGEAGHI